MKIGIKKIFASPHVHVSRRRFISVVFFTICGLFALLLFLDGMIFISYYRIASGPTVPATVNKTGIQEDKLNKVLEIIQKQQGPSG